MILWLYSIISRIIILCLLYRAVIKLFDRDLIIQKGAKTLGINTQFPTQQQVFSLLKREFIESQFINDPKNRPYTFSDRRFYQVFYFDFLINSPQHIEDLSLSFPKELGGVYVTLTRSSNQEVTPGETWTDKKALNKH